MKILILFTITFVSIAFCLPKIDTMIFTKKWYELELTNGNFFDYRKNQTIHQNHYTTYIKKKETGFYLKSDRRNEDINDYYTNNYSYNINDSMSLQYSMHQSWKPLIELYIKQYFNFRIQNVLSDFQNIEHYSLIYNGIKLEYYLSKVEPISNETVMFVHKIFSSNIGELGVKIEIDTLSHSHFVCGINNSYYIEPINIDSLIKVIKTNGNKIETIHHYVP